jgi:cysteine-rich repeat protein
VPSLGRIAAIVLAAATCAWGVLSCEDDLGPNACGSPGENQECPCPDGRVSLQTCNAFNEWGTCYCDKPVCGDGDLDQGETCDDGNTTSGDGCDETCESEGGQGGSGPSSSSSFAGPASSSSGSASGGGGAGGAGGAVGGGGAGGDGGQ